MTDNIDEELDSPVPKEHSELFNQWDVVSGSVAQNKPWRGIKVTDLMTKLAVLKRTVHIKPEKVKWASSASSGYRVMSSHVTDKGQQSPSSTTVIQRTITLGPREVPLWVIFGTHRSCEDGSPCNLHF